MILSQDCFLSNDQILFTTTIDKNKFGITFVNGVQQTAFESDRLSEFKETLTILSQSLNKFIVSVCDKNNKESYFDRQWLGIKSSNFIICESSAIDKTCSVTISFNNSAFELKCNNNLSIIENCRMNFIVDVQRIIIELMIVIASLNDDIK